MITSGRVGSDRHESAAAALTELSALAIALGRTAHLPAVMLTITPDLDTPIVTCDADERHPALVLAVDECLLYGDPSERDGQIAAASMACEVATHTVQPGPATRPASITLAGALLAMLAIAVLDGPRWAIAAATAVAAVAGLAHWALMRRWQLLVDAAAMYMLTSAGLDGRACMGAMLDHLARDESRLYRAYGWLLSTVPTARRRRRALDHAPVSSISK